MAKKGKEGLSELKTELDLDEHIVPVEELLSRYKIESIDQVRLSLGLGLF